MFPRTAILIPAWNEAAVIASSLDRLMRLEYPPDRLRVFVIDDASTDETPRIARAKAAQNPGRVFHLRREVGGQGKAHTLNHGLAEVLADSWMQAVLIMDSDVIYEPAALRRMTCHLADPGVGAVTAYIKEGSQPGNNLTRFIGNEYITAQAAARRSQNVLGAVACRAGARCTRGPTSRPSAAGLTPARWPRTRSRRSGPSSAAPRWSSSRTPSSGPRSPAASTGCGSSGCAGGGATCRSPGNSRACGALVALYYLNAPLAWDAFHVLWITTFLTYVFITLFALLIDPGAGRRVWREAILFPGVGSARASDRPGGFAGIAPA